MVGDSHAGVQLGDILGYICWHWTEAAAKTSDRIIPGRQGKTLDTGWFF